MTDSVPIIRFGGSVPKDLREWDRVLRNLNDFVQQLGAQFQISPEAQIPTNDSTIDGARAFLPPPLPVAPAIESQMMAVKAFAAPYPTPERIEAQLAAVMSFLPPVPAAPRFDDSQSVLAAQVFL